jgi:hypothetical protein
MQRAKKLDSIHEPVNKIISTILFVALGRLSWMAFGLLLIFSSLLITTYRRSSTLFKTSLDHFLHQVLHNSLVGFLLRLHQDRLALLRCKLGQLLFHCDAVVLLVIFNVV